MRIAGKGGHVARKRFGQHFLHDPYILSRIVESIAPRHDDRIVEIGPGEGALTRPLLEQVDMLTAIEIDRDLAAALAAEFPPERLAGAETSGGDADEPARPPAGGAGQ